MVKHTQTIRRLLLTNCLSVFDHFVRLALKGLKYVALQWPSDTEALNAMTKTLISFMCLMITHMKCFFITLIQFVKQVTFLNFKHSTTTFYEHICINNKIINFARWWKKIILTKKFEKRNLSYKLSFK